MILKLLQAGEMVNEKHIDRLYAEARLLVNQGNRKKIAQFASHPLPRPTEVTRGLQDANSSRGRCRKL